jgi:hypothetical protein
MPPMPRTSLAAAALSTLALGAEADARPMEGRFAAGLERSLAGASGLALRYFTSDSLAIGVTLGVDVALVDDADAPGATDVAAAVATSFGALWHVGRSEHAHFALGARLALGYRTLASQRLVDPAATASDLDMALELPLALELWLSDHFSVSCTTGLLIHLVPESGAQLRGEGPGGSAPPGAIGVGLGAGDITATLGALYYF